MASPPAPRSATTPVHPRSAPIARHPLQPLINPPNAGAERGRRHHITVELPEPFEQAYTLAQEAQTAGDTDLVVEIADTLRVQQALFDVDEFTQRTASRLRATVQRPRPQPEDAQLVM